MIKRSLTTGFIKLGMFTILIAVVFYGCTLPDDPEKNCNDPIIIDETVTPIHLNFYYSHSSQDSKVSEFYYFNTVKRICPDEFVTVGCVLNTVGTDFYEDVASVKLYWHYRPWITDYKDYIFLVRSPDNPNLWAGAIVLLPLGLGFSTEYPAELSFELSIKLYDPLDQDDAAPWKDQNINNFKLEINGTRF